MARKLGVSPQRIYWWRNRVKKQTPSRRAAPPAFIEVALADKSSIKKLRPETLEAINRILVAHACGKGIEKGQKVRTDCTGVESLIHEPKDSWLLYDSVRVLTRLTKQAKNLLPNISMTDHVCRAKRCNREIENTRGQDNKNKLYKDLPPANSATYLALARKVIEQDPSPGYRCVQWSRVPAEPKHR